MKSKKYNKTAPIITLSIGFLLMGFSFFVYKNTEIIGFLSNVNSDTFGVGLALVIGGSVWLIKKILKD